MRVDQFNTFAEFVSNVSENRQSPENQQYFHDGYLVFSRLCAAYGVPTIQSEQGVITPESSSSSQPVYVTLYDVSQENFTSNDMLDLTRSQLSYVRFRDCRFTNVDFSRSRIGTTNTDRVYENPGSDPGTFTMEDCEFNNVNFSNSFISGRTGPELPTAETPESVPTRINISGNMTDVWFDNIEVFYATGVIGDHSPEISNFRVNIRCNNPDNVSFGADVRTRETYYVPDGYYGSSVFPDTDIFQVEFSGENAENIFFSLNEGESYSLVVIDADSIKNVHFENARIAKLESDHVQDSFFNSVEIGNFYITNITNSSIQQSELKRGKIINSLGNRYKKNSLKDAKITHSENDTYSDSAMDKAEFENITNANFTNIKIENSNFLSSSDNIFSNIQTDHLKIGNSTGDKFINSSVLKNSEVEVIESNDFGNTAFENSNFKWMTGSDLSKARFNQLTIDRSENNNYEDTEISNSEIKMSENDDYSDVKFKETKFGVSRSSDFNNADFSENEALPEESYNNSYVNAAMDNNGDADGSLFIKRSIGDNFENAKMRFRNLEGASIVNPKSLEKLDLSDAELQNVELTLSGELVSSCDLKTMLEAQGAITTPQTKFSHYKSDLYCDMPGRIALITDVSLLVLFVFGYIYKKYTNAPNKGNIGNPKIETPDVSPAKFFNKEGKEIPEANNRLNINEGANEMTPLL